MALILLLYFIGLLVFLIIGSIGIFHLIRHKMPGDNATKGIYIFVGVSIFIILASLIFIFRAD